MKRDKKRGLTSRDFFFSPFKKKTEEEVVRSSYEAPRIIKSWRLTVSAIGGTPPPPPP